MTNMHFIVHTYYINNEYTTIFIMHFIYDIPSMYYILYIMKKEV